MSETRIQTVAGGLWTVEDDLFMAARAVHFPLRMTVAARADGGLLLISPVAIDDALAAAIAELGEVRDILAPNGFHHLYAEAAAQRYPAARLHLSPALRDKRPDLCAAGQVFAGVPEGWAPSLHAELVEGAPSLGEVAVLHRPSRTLIVTDLVFNMHRTRGWMMGLVLRMLGAHGRLAQSRYMRSQVRDLPGARLSYQQLLSLDFDRLVMAHGDIVESGARSQLHEALSWLVGESPTRGEAGADGRSARA